jgi:hypothetical protein
MKHHERELFIYTLRTGKVFIQCEDLELVVIPATFEQNIRSLQIYNKAYEQAYAEEIMTESETLLWMKEKDLWNDEDDEKIKGLEKDIERLKVEIYNARNNDNLKERIRLYIRAGEKQLQEKVDEKTQYFSNTCEGIAATEKTFYIIKNTTYLNRELYNFEKISLPQVLSEWQNSILSEKQYRELARTEPWKSIWTIKNKVNTSLFENPSNTDLTYNQKNLVIWSQMYDNIQESLDCPTNDVINDDDMLDGWFIIQGKKRDKERAEKEFEDGVKSDKIKNASEVFVMANGSKDKDRIDGMNNVHGQTIKNQRMALIKRKGSVEQHQFMDEKLRVQTQATQMYKDHVKGGR